MAVIAPSSLVGSRSPIFITANYASLASSLVDVTLEVFMWNGSRSSKPASATYTLFRDVFAGKDVSFDISKFVQEYIDNDYTGFAPTDVSYVPDGSVYWVQVDYNVSYYNKSDPPTISNETGSTDIFEVSNGYHIFIEASNKEVAKGYASVNVNKYIQDSGNEVVPVYLGKWGEGYDIYWGYKDRVLADGGTIEGGSACANIGLYKVEFLSDGGDNIDLPITEADLQGLQPEQRIMLLPCGVTNLAAWLDSEGESLNYTNYYDLNLKDKDNTTLDTRRFYPTCESKYSPLQAQFINKNGVWESVNFFKASQEQIQTRSSEYRRSIGSSGSTGFSYDTTLEQYKRFNTNYRNSIRVNTGWVGEDYNELMTQLLASERVLLDGKPVNVGTGSLQLQKHITEKTINFTIDLQYAYDTIYE
tara:strand:+ start:3947 stop:5197 length:1251 start_codon:yes stop_codon:yes gene_type:complete